MTTNHHTALTAAGALTADVLNKPLSQLDQQLKDMDDGTHAFTAIDIDGGNIDGATIGGTTPGAGTFTTLTVNNNLNFGSAFYVELRQPQTIANNTDTLIWWNKLFLDTDSVVDIDYAVFSFTPTVAGYYMFTAGITGDSSTASTTLVLSLRKNGSAVTIANDSTKGSFSETITLTDIQQANGTTDYFDIYFKHTSGGSKILNVGSGECYFGGMRMY